MRTFSRTGPGATGLAARVSSDWRNRRHLTKSRYCPRKHGIAAQFVELLESFLRQVGTRHRREVGFCHESQSEALGLRDEFVEVHRIVDVGEVVVVQVPRRIAAHALALGGQQPAVGIVGVVGYGDEFH